MSEYDWLQRRRQLKMKATFGIVASIPLILMFYFLVLGIASLRIYHPVFWVLLIFSLIWFYLFVNDLKEILNKIGLSYEIKRLIRDYLVKTKFGNILLVDLSYPAGPYIQLNFTTLLCNSNLLEYDELMEYIIIHSH